MFNVLFFFFLNFEFYIKNLRDICGEKPKETKKNKIPGRKTVLIKKRYYDTL